MGKHQSFYSLIAILFRKRVQQGVKMPSGQRLARVLAPLTAYIFLWLLNAIHAVSSLRIGKPAKGK